MGKGATRRGTSQSNTLKIREPCFRITDVDYVKDYTLALTFNNGTRKIVDLEPYLVGAVFEPLRNLENFRQYGLNHWTIEWASGADLAPEFLYSIAN